MYISKVFTSSRKNDTPHFITESDGPFAAFFPFVSTDKREEATKFKTKTEARKAAASTAEGFKKKYGYSRVEVESV